MIVDGYVGQLKISPAGKTTLINHILTANHGKKIAVVENEYGEISIDRHLVNQQLGSAEEIFEVRNRPGRTPPLIMA